MATELKVDLYYSVNLGLILQVLCHIHGYGVKYYGYNNTFDSLWRPIRDKHDTLGDVTHDCMDIINGCNDNSLCRADSDESAEHTGRKERDCCEYHNNITCLSYTPLENCTGVHDTSSTNCIKHVVKWCEAQGRIATDVTNCLFVKPVNPATGAGSPTSVIAKRWNVYESRLQLIDGGENTCTNRATIANSASIYVSGNIQLDEYELTSTYIWNYNNIVYLPSILRNMTEMKNKLVQG